MYETNLRRIRMNECKTQQEIAYYLEMNVTVYARYERGERDLPLSIGKKLAVLYNVSIDYLAGIKEL
ncbi:helix-turn-helix domain-containing protein [Ruminococcus champanellensis]|uniref:helix-turn-helix domain-containing protein n=1 Tax=Ruminococcus champanellensis TaxID=1161942 RepID=UPI0023F583CD|nr:helix-turn-helix transcriptional regulator [Ruminococcus champanellensis]